MKKFIAAFLLIFIVNLGCKKMDIGGGGLCACSLMPQTQLSLIIKNNIGADLLNPVTTGYFDKNKIQLYYKDANNVIKQINFDISKPFTYSNDLKINYYQLNSSEIVIQSKSIENFYLKLGDGKVYELNLKTSNYAVEKLSIDKAEAPKEFPSVTTAPFNSIYTLKI
ncbi:hypothetical protein [Pedobacter jamesrossensis]|uniref:DUF4397 domain-containing protein n=1 Tax=Pedobacter jamesrossensis TaxID=1908238 RepID=A0ABV8NFC6_9SPHI